MRKGLTFATHWVGSRIGSPVAGLMSGCQWPLSGFDTQVDGANRPSPTLESSMALAAACPIVMPCTLNRLSRIAASDALYCDVRVARRPAGSESPGDVEMRF